MNLMASGGGGEITPVPGCSTHTRFHRNEEAPIVGQRLLAELVCKKFAAARDTTAPTVAAAMYAYRDHCAQDVLASARFEDAAQGYQATPSPHVRQQYPSTPITRVCGLLEPERERIVRAMPVLQAILSSWMADRPSEMADDLEWAEAAISCWLLEQTVSEGEP